MLGSLDLFLGLQNIQPGTTPIIEWSRFQIFLVGYVAIALFIFLGVYLLKRLSNHSFSNNRIIVSFSITITSYFYFIWSYIFSFLINVSSDFRYPFKKEVTIIPFTILVIFFFCVFLGSLIWLVIDHRKMIQKGTDLKTASFGISIYYQNAFSMGILIFLPFYYIIYNSQILKICRNFPEYLLHKIKFMSRTIIIYSLFSFATLLIGISFLLNTNLSGPFETMNNKGFIFGFLSIGVALLLVSIISQLFLNRIIKDFIIDNKHFNEK